MFRELIFPSKNSPSLEAITMVDEFPWILISPLTSQTSDLGCERLQIGFSSFLSESEKKKSKGVIILSLLWKEIMMKELSEFLPLSYIVAAFSPLQPP